MFPGSTMTSRSTERRHEENQRLFFGWNHPVGTPVLVRRANGTTLRTVTTSRSFTLSGGAYVTVEGIPGNTALRRVSLLKVRR